MKEIKKRLSTTLLLLALVQFTFAQALKGQLQVGGSGDLSMTYNGTTSTFNLSIAPSLGIFVVNGFAVGGRYSIGINNVRSFDTKNNVYTSTITFTTLIGPALKYYIGKKQLKGLLSASGAYTVTTSIHKTDVGNRNGFSVMGLGGLAYFLNPHLSVETGFYVSATGGEKILPTSRFGISVGLFAFLDKKKQE